MSDEEPKAKPATSTKPLHLTKSEQESLRQDGKRVSARLKKLIADSKGK